MMWVAPASTKVWDRLDRRSRIVVVNDELDRPLDLVRIAPDRRAMLAQDAVLVLEDRDVVAGRIPDVGVFGDHAEGQLLAAAADDDRRVGPLDRLRLGARILQAGSSAPRKVVRCSVQRLL